MNQARRKITPSEGFTIVELIVTIVVISMFLTVFLQSYLVMVSQRVKVAKQAEASDIAFTNLNKITTRPPGLVCDTNGYTLLSSTDGVDNASLFFRPEIDKTLGSGRTQTVVAYPTASCSDFTGSPVRIVSTVRFDINSPGGPEEVIHASYIP